MRHRRSGMALHQAPARAVFQLGVDLERRLLWRNGLITRDIDGAIRGLASLGGCCRGGRAFSSRRPGRGVQEDQRVSPALEGCVATPPGATSLALVNLPARSFVPAALRPHDPPGSVRRPVLAAPVLVVVLVVGNQFHLRLFRWSGPASTAVASDGRVTVIGDQDLEAVELRLELPVPRRQPSPPARHHVPGRSGLWGTNGRRSSSSWELSTTSTASKSSTVLRRFESESCTAQLPFPCLRSDRCSS